MLAKVHRATADLVEMREATPESTEKSLRWQWIGGLLCGLIIVVGLAVAGFAAFEINDLAAADEPDLESIGTLSGIGFAGVAVALVGVQSLLNRRFELRLHKRLRAIEEALGV